jgi:ribose-phosphate pyrophosphokinase
MYIIGGTASQRIAKDISQQLNQPLANVKIKRFPDSELYIRILENIGEENIILIQNTYPDTNIIELLLFQDAISEAGGNKPIIVIPYFAYSRQDKKFEDGEPISARAIAQHIGLFADSIITVDPHKEHILDFFNVPAYSCSAVLEIAKYISKKNIDFILAPDQGALDRAKQISTSIHCKYDYMEKTRINGKTVKIKPKHLEVKNKNVAIIDDIISTGGTMAHSIKELKKQGAKEVYVACTHGLFANGAKEKLLSSGCDEIISSDTIENEFSKVRVSPSILNILLKRLH